MTDAELKTWWAEARKASAFFRAVRERKHNEASILECVGTLEVVRVRGSNKVFVRLPSNQSDPS